MAEKTKESKPKTEVKAKSPAKADAPSKDSVSPKAKASSKKPETTPPKKPEASTKTPAKTSNALEALKAKAKALEESVEEAKDVDLKKQVKLDEEPEKADTLVPIEDYLKSSIHLGTRVITPDMRSYVYKRRADGLAVFNTALLDDKIREGADFLGKFAPKDIVIICKREAGWKAVELFAKITGIRAFTKKYPAGILTNPNLDSFIETDLILICDPWIDKNALLDAKKIKIPVLSVCDTNNYTKDVTQIIPGNNKSAKSLGIIFYLLAKLYVEKQKLDVQIPPISEWIEDWESLIPPK